MVLYILYIISYPTLQKYCNREPSNFLALTMNETISIAIQFATKLSSCLNLQSRPLIHILQVPLEYLPSKPRNKTHFSAVEAFRCTTHGVAWPCTPFHHVAQETHVKE